ncbi:MAG TPA: ABC transporter substrate-binding protein [Actinomycetota bacterium]|nr:ABC transporter substrate-binding protein [Actinomycetota bacterium]
MRLARRIGFFAVFALVAAACEAQPPAEERPAREETFVYATTSEAIVGWDPATENSNSILPLSNVYETLTFYDPETQDVEPLLATEWSTSPDGLTWTFKVRRGVKFHTGREMTARDVEASIERTIELGQGAAYIWSAVRSIEAVDDETVVFRLKHPAPIDLIASAGYAAYIYDTKVEGVEDLNAWFEEGNETGTGPYRVAEWNPGEEVELRLEAFPDYWQGWDGPHYQRVVYRVVPEATTSAQLLRAGEVTFVQRMTPQLFQTFEGDPGFETVEGSSWQNLLALLNTRKGPLADVTVRRAISYAIDYEGIISALQGAAVPSSGVVPPGLWGHFDDLGHVHDPGRAAELLAEAGYGPGGAPMELELTYTQGDADEQLVATIIKSNLADLNVDVKVRGLQWQTQWAKAKSADPPERQDIFIFYWWPDYADPISWFANLFHCEDEPFFNLSYYCNPRLDEMIDAVPTYTATDRERALAMYREMQEILLEDMPAVYLYNQNYQHTMLSSVGGYRINPAYPNVVFAYEVFPEE